MSSNNPSFYRLFRRSRYRRLPLGHFQEPEKRAVREERERFAAAALAFCLKHDPAFRKDLWQKICRVEEDPEEMPPIGDVDVELEPWNWADLRLISNHEHDRFIWVVEVKAGARLEAKQDPSKKAFRDPTEGYGTLISAEEKEETTKLRYIVLGARERLKLERHPKGRISVQQRHWSQLPSTGSNPQLIGDLLQSLALLGVPGLNHQFTENMKIRQSLESAAQAFRLLHDASERLGFLTECRKPDIVTNETGWHFGLQINKRSDKRRRAANHVQLETLVEPSSEALVWFGYLQSPDSKESCISILEVWFYCGNKKSAQRIEKVLKLHFPTARIDPASTYVVVTGSNRETDRAWFESIFTALGLKLNE